LLNCLSGAAVASVAQPAGALIDRMPYSLFHAGPLDSLVRSDFAAGRIVRVNGWVLSATEARLCGSCG
jgi:hypothetical protein